MQSGLSGARLEVTDRIDSVRLVLVRHGAIAQQWKGICYGSQDVPLCDHWISAAQPLVQQLVSLGPTNVFHSGLRRSQWLAECVCVGAGAGIQVDHRLRERNFGQWEGKTWDDVYASDPDNFHGLIDKPDTYRPPGGETTNELQQRVVQWYDEMLGKQRDRMQTLIAITHSGPIAALAGHVLGLHPTQWSPWLVGYGEIVEISVARDSRIQVSKGISP